LWRSATEKGEKVRFHRTDVFLPGAEELEAASREEEELEGTVIDFSDSGLRPKAFAIVEVVQKQTVVVPTEKLEPASGIGAADDGNP
jgi:hypothetical protein